jgi:hypothetical protein
MVKRRTLLLVVLVLFAAAVVLCAGSKGGRSEGLHFVGGEPKPGQLKDKGLVISTHGWIEEGRGDWPEDMAVDIQNRVDPNMWFCGYFDWSKGAKKINPTDAAKYARDVGGPQLARQIIKLGTDFRHIHMIGHSGGCWLISEAAKNLAEVTNADIHLTFLDAYVPFFWDENLLGDVNMPSGTRCWIDQYYTRDYTLGWTEQDLSNAHNVDVTGIDQNLKDHNFPWRWYYATITGKFPKGYFLDDRKLTWTAGGIEYGFFRSREAADPNGWKKSIKLPVGNKAVKIKKKR